MAEDKRHAPYLAWKTFYNLLDELRGALPSRIDRSYLRKKSGTDQTYLIAALKAFGLIRDDFTVENSLKALVAAESHERQELVAQILRTHYAPVFELADNATPQELDDAFREAFGTTGDTLRKAETFFLHAAAYADIKLSPFFKATRGTTSGTRKARKPKDATGEGQDEIKKEMGKPTAPPTSEAAMRSAYFELLRQKVEASDEIDSDLLDRMERLMGLEPPKQNG